MHNIAVDDHTHKEAKTLCKTLDLTLGELFKHCVVYVKKTGIDPSKADSESPHKVVKELEKRIGQLVAFIKTQEQEKLNPLLEHLIILTRELDDVLKKLPKEESLEEAKKASEKHNDILVASHKIQMKSLTESQQKINDENKLMLNKLTETIAGLRVEQKELKEAIEAKKGIRLFN